MSLIHNRKFFSIYEILTNFIILINESLLKINEITDPIITINKISNLSKTSLQKFANDKFFRLIFWIFFALFNSTKYHLIYLWRLIRQNEKVKWNSDCEIRGKKMNDWCLVTLIKLW